MSDADLKTHPNAERETDSADRSESDAEHGRGEPTAQTTVDGGPGRSGASTFAIKTYEVHENRLTSSEGRIVSGPTHAIISLRADARPDTVDYLLKKAERGVDEWPDLLAALKEVTGG